MPDWIDPITRKRLQRFREYRRAYYSLLIIVFLYLTSLVAELLCNDRPLFVHYENQSLFPRPVLLPRGYLHGQRPVDPSGLQDHQRPLPHSPETTIISWSSRWCPFGPQEIIQASSIPVDDQVEVLVQREPRVASVNIDAGFVVRRQQRSEWFFTPADRPVEGLDFLGSYDLPEAFKEAVALRFANQPAPAWSYSYPPGEAEKQVILSLSPYKPRNRIPRTVRILLREALQQGPGTEMDIHT